MDLDTIVSRFAAIHAAEISGRIYASMTDVGAPQPERVRQRAVTIREHAQAIVDDIDRTEREKR